MIMVRKVAKVVGAGGKKISSFANVNTSSSKEEISKNSIIKFFGQASALLGGANHRDSRWPDPARSSTSS